MGALKTILIIVEVLCSIALIGVVLFQSGKESGLSGALAGKADSYLSKNKGSNLDQMLASSTKWIAAAWVVLTLMLSLI
jgi:preprotein translocase subunit SecG